MKIKIKTSAISTNIKITILINFQKAQKLMLILVILTFITESKEVLEIIPYI